jgi:hypothetical protein
MISSKNIKKHDPNKYVPIVILSPTTTSPWHACIFACMQLVPNATEGTKSTPRWILRHKYKTNIYIFAKGTIKNEKIPKDTKDNGIFRKHNL